jgi:hypothetical protein
MVCTRVETSLASWDHDQSRPIEHPADQEVLQAIRQAHVAIARMPTRENEVLRPVCAFQCVTVRGELMPSPDGMLVRPERSTIKGSGPGDSLIARKHP